MTPLKISTEQLIALHSFFAEAVAVSEARLAEISGCETEIEVLEIRCTSLGSFGEQGMRLSEDLVAGVIGRLEGVLPGSLNVVLEPEEALLWAQIGNDTDPLDTFVSLGRVLLEGIAELGRCLVRIEVAAQKPAEFIQIGSGNRREFRHGHEVLGSST